MDEGADKICLTGSTVRKEVQAFLAACETVAQLFHQNELTHEERELVVNFASGLTKEVAPASSPVDEEIPLAATLSNVPLID